MSEELIQKKLTKHGIKFDNYEFYSIGNTTLNQLKKYEIIPDLDYGTYDKLKPDALLVDRSNKKNIQVIAVIEYKSHSEFNKDEKRLLAYKQCNTYCELLNSRFGIITDNTEYTYINPSTKEENSDICYNDNEIFNNKTHDRSFSFIKREDGYSLSNYFILEENNEKTNETLKLIRRILSNINEENSQFNKEPYKNPSNLAKSIWQTVWISKSASPEKSLSTFIELFVFKFLSDLNVLDENDSGVKISFNNVLNEVSKENCLKYYSNNVRPHITELFPKNPEDSTTLINGISLNANVEEDNETFYNLLKKFDDFGDLRNIDPEFKSRLFEDFLKKSISKKNWGQLFTPRNVVKAIVEMSDIEKLPDGANVCDPACGVGGFILEPILNKRVDDYYFDNDGLKSKLNYFGFEKGFENEEKLTIVLAKANFIISLSKLLENNPNKTEDFANMFNNIFKIYTDTILGSLSEVKEDFYDLIMSNPPYVTSGSSTIKEAIKNKPKLKKYYKINGTGVEGLFLEKMIRELKPKGKAYIVIPDGILSRINDNKLRKFILDECILEAIISLPRKTFYTTPKKTYIISLTKKEHKFKQTEPVFTYLVSKIGESLDSYRVPEDKNDLESMVRSYRYFISNKTDYKPDDKLCKIQEIDKFFDEIDNHWLVDRWWTREEKVELGLVEEKIILSEEEFNEKIIDIQDKINKLFNEVKNE